MSILCSTAIKGGGLSFGEENELETAPEVINQTALKSRNEEELFRSFVGENADKFVEIYRDTMSESRGGKAFSVNSLNWMVLFLPTAWFFYRKMYLYGAGLIIIPALIFVLFPDLPNSTIFGATGVLIIFSNRIYVSYAVNKIRKIESLDLSPHEKDFRILEQGDTSFIGAIIGAVIPIASISLILVNTFTGELPECDDPDFFHKTEISTRQILDKKGLIVESLSITPSQELERGLKKGQRICSAEVKSNGETAIIYFGFRWADKYKSEYEAFGAGSREELANKMR